MHKWIWLLIALLPACSDSGGTARCAQLEIHDPWVREAPPGASVLAGYMTLRNPADAALRIQSAQSGDFARIEFHQSLQEDGRMAMRALPALEIPGRGELVLEPGGRHMMLFEPQRPLRGGDRAKFTLACAADDKISIEAEVRRVTEASADHSHHH